MHIGNKDTGLHENAIKTIYNYQTIKTISQITEQKMPRINTR